jgi:hypothetical protein
MSAVQIAGKEYCLKNIFGGVQRDCEPRGEVQ